MPEISDVRESIRAMRQAIRSHRDQKGDDRCWLDDFSVWKWLPDSPQDPSNLPSFEEGMRACRAFYAFRRSETVDPIPSNACMDPARWDDDLLSLSQDEQEKEYAKIIEVIRTHRDVRGRERTLEDDRLLYAVLPERIPADFRLPAKEIFIDGIQPGVGCPDFWNSHEACNGPHNLHAWGPCKGV